MNKKCMGCGIDLGGTGDTGDLCVSCKPLRAFVTRVEFDKVKHERDYLQEQLDKILKERITLPPILRFSCQGCSLIKENIVLQEKLETLQRNSIKLTKIRYGYSWCIEASPVDYEGFTNYVKEILDEKDKENENV